MLHNEGAKDTLRRQPERVFAVVIAHQQAEEDTLKQAWKKKCQISRTEIYKQT